MKVRKVLADSFRLYVRNCWRLVPPAVILAALPASPILLKPGPIGEGIAALLALPIMFVLQALHVVESAEVREGRPRPVWKSLAELRPCFKTLLLMMLLAFVRFVVYLVVFMGALYEAVVHQNRGWAIGIVVAGALGLVYLVARWSLLVPVIVLEGVTARKSFKRCGRLVGRRVLRVATVVFLGSIVYGIVDVVSLLAIHMSVSDEAGRAFAEKLITEPLAAPFLALLGTTVYFTLRDERDGSGLTPRLVPARTG
jgi:MFS family permease